MSTPNNPPAFPVTGFQFSHQNGMQLRDFFAAFALAGLLSANDEDLDRIGDIPTYAYQIADEMLFQRGVEKGGGE